ncbi:MAG: T9SS type A sorting domain-containing protein [Phaeodactylibacter sp.]|uniref:T9SS type A sorting domain-containing protein n=1 Tax=Phaeodactylibacter sp. TaxID=1940289 RepID=UPI0032EB7F25
MKYALTLLFCGLTLLLTGQEGRMDYFFHELSSEVDQPYLRTNGDHLFSSSSTTWVAATVIDDCRNPSAFYWTEELSPVQKWTIGIKDEDISRVVEADWYGDTLIILGIEPCYDGGTAPITRIGKFDTLGNLLMSAFYFDCEEDFGISVEPRPLENTCPVMDVADDGSVLLATTVGLLRVAPGENLFPQSVAVNIDSLIGLVSLPGTYVGLATRTELAIVDWATDTILLSLDHTATAMTAADSAIWYLTEGELHQISADLSTGTWALPSGDAEQVRITTFEGRPLVYEPGIPDFKAWLFNPETEAFDLLIDWALDGVEIFAVEPFREDTFFVSGQLADGRRGFVKKATPASFSFQQTFDIGIRSLSLELVDIEVDVEASGEIFNYTLDFRQTMEIENYGTGVIDDCILEWSTRHDWCAIPGYRVISDLALQPGDIQTITDTLRHNFSTSEPIISDSIFYTFNAFGPNHYLDAYAENNSATEGFLVTNTDKQRLPGATIQLFPNPATGNVQLQSDFPLDQLELYDLFGRLLHTQQLGGTHQATLERQGVPSGIYLLRFQSGNRYGIQRVIWSDN